MLDKLKSALKNLFTFKGGIDTAIKVCIIIVLFLLVLEILAPIIKLAAYIAKAIFSLIFICLLVIACIWLIKKLFCKK